MGLFGDEGIIGAFFADETTAKPIASLPGNPASLLPVGGNNNVAAPPALLPPPSSNTAAFIPIPPANGTTTERTVPVGGLLDDSPVIAAGGGNRTTTTRSPSRDVTEIVEVATVMDDVQSNEVAPVEGESLETAASENVAVETPVVENAVVADSPVVAEVQPQQPAKDTSEEEDLIEGIVNTLIEDDAEGK